MQCRECGKEVKQKRKDRVITFCGHECRLIFQKRFRMSNLANGLRREFRGDIVRYVPEEISSEDPVINEAMQRYFAEGGRVTKYIAKEGDRGWITEEEQEVLDSVSGLG